jgi:uncharacterized protein YkwD
VAIDPNTPTGAAPTRRWLLPFLACAAVAAAIFSLTATRGGPDDATTSGPPAFAGAALSGTPASGRGRSSLYPPKDPWKRYLAGERACPGGERTDLSAAREAQVMTCLIDWARRRAGLAPLPRVPLLTSTARQKANEIVRCRNFAHDACSGDPASDVRAAGYQGSFGENLYIAAGRFGAPRVALDGWLNSPGHRENLFRAEWKTQGIALVKLPVFGQYRNMSLWVSHFGSE